MSCANAVSCRFSGVVQVVIGTSRATAIGLATSGADDQRDQVRRQRRRRREREPPPAAPVVVVADHLAVRYRDRLVGHARHAQPPHRLERRLVEAREQAPRVRRLELRDRDAARAVEAAQPRAERPAIGDAHGALARRQILGERQRHGLALGVRRRLRGDGRAAPTSALAVRHLQADRVHGDRAARGAQRDFDRQLAFEPVAVQVEAQVRVVGLRLDVGREAKVFSQRHAGVSSGEGAFYTNLRADVARVAGHRAAQSRPTTPTRPFVSRISAGSSPAS